MKTINIGNQIIEEYTSLKEIVSMVVDNYITNMDYLIPDQTLYIEYKDGSSYYVSDCIEYGKFKKTGIKKVIEDNGSTYAVYGNYSIRIEDECLYII